MQTKQSHRFLNIKSNLITTFRINSNPTGALFLLNLFFFFFLSLLLLLTAIISILLCRPVTMTWHHKTSEAFRAIFWPNGNTITIHPGCGDTNLANEAEVKKKLQPVLLLALCFCRKFLCCMGRVLMFCIQTFCISGC